MNQNDGFTGGFLAGVVVGGLFGGVLGVLTASKLSNNAQEEPLLKPKKPVKKIGSEESIEDARRSLEDKIAQLNMAIDDVRQQLSEVNGNALEKE